MVLSEFKFTSKLFEFNQDPSGWILDNLTMNVFRDKSDYILARVSNADVPVI